MIIVVSKKIIFYIKLNSIYNQELWADPELRKLYVLQLWLINV